MLSEKYPLLYRLRYIVGLNRVALKKYKAFPGKNILKSGWPDEMRDGNLFEIKRGKDYLRLSQIACHEWIYKKFKVWVKIEVYENKEKNSKPIVYPNYKIYMAAMEKQYKEEMEKKNREI